MAAREWSPTHSPRARAAAFTFLAAFVAFLYAPTVVLIVFSFNDSTVPTFPIEGLTTRWYADLASNDALIDSVVASLKVAAVTSVTATSLGLAGAWALARSRFRGKSGVQAVLILPLIVPYVVLGIGLLILFQAFGTPLSLFTVAAGHVVITMPYVMLTLLPRILRLDPQLEEAAQDLGASGLYRLRHVILPLIAPGLVAAFLMAFVISMDEFPIASFVVGSEPTFPVYLFGQLRYPDQLPQVIAVTAVVQTISLVLVVIAEMLRRKGAAGERQ